MSTRRRVWAEIQGVVSDYSLLFYFFNVFQLQEIGLVIRKSKRNKSPAWFLLGMCISLTIWLALRPLPTVVKYFTQPAPLGSSGIYTIMQQEGNQITATNFSISSHTWSIGVEPKCKAVAFTDLTIDGRGYIVVGDLKTGKEIRTYGIFGESVSEPVFSPKGDLLAFYSHNNETHVAGIYVVKWDDPTAIPRLVQSGSVKVSLFTPDTLYWSPDQKSLGWKTLLNKEPVMLAVGLLESGDIRLLLNEEAKDYVPQTVDRSELTCVKS